MGAKRAFAVTSGMTALDVIARLVQAGDEIVAGNDLYGGTNRLLTFLAKSQNIKTHHVDTTKAESVLPYLSEKTKLVLLETPTNPLIRIADIPTISQYVHDKCPRALVVVDNTMMSPYLQRPLELGADISYHSATKYLAGHHDLMAGVLGTRDEAVAEVTFFLLLFYFCVKFIVEKGQKDVEIASLFVVIQKKTNILTPHYLSSSNYTTSLMQQVVVWVHLILGYCYVVSRR